MQDHSRFMRVALSHARRQLGHAWPNPSVGAVVVKNGQIIAAATTAKGGRPHAETQALADAGEQAKGATLYVTLEPCSHHGKTPPCVDAIIAAGISTIVIACTDPNPLVSCKGIAALTQAGIQVIEDVCKLEALDINRGFFSVIEKNRPYVALKIASSQDGKITAPGQRWLTGEPARHYGHLLRAQHDAIATGIGTVLADDPLLTCRLPGLEERSPVRVVFDRQNRLPKTAKILPAWVICSSPSSLVGEGGVGGHSPRTQSLNMGHQPPTLTLPHKGGGNEIAEALTQLAEKGITRLLVEGGSQLTTAFLESGLVDTIYWFRAPMTVGDAGLAAFDESRVNLQHFDVTERIALGSDTLSVIEARL